MKTISDIKIDVTMNIESKEGLPLTVMGFLNSPPIVFYTKSHMENYLSDLVQVFYYLIENPATFDVVCKIVEDNSNLLKSSAE